MNTATVKSVVGRFIESKVPEVLALKGKWGVGKTYVWNKLVLELKEKAALPSYSYVSLFGISSISELRLAICAKTRPIESLGEKLTAASINQNWLEYGWTGLKGLGYWFSRARDIPLARNVTVGFDSLAPHLIFDTLICLDDFERSSSGLTADTLLGFVSSLKEEKNCKVALIFNDERLKDDQSELYERYREKLIDIEILYSPTAEEAATLALEVAPEWSATVRARVVGLCITNIRLLRRINRLVELVCRPIKDMHEKAIEQAVNTTVLLAWCYYEPDGEKPSFEYLRRFNSFESAFARVAKKEKGEQQNPKEAAWEQLLSGYGFSNMDQFDLEILKVVKQGFVEETALVEEAKKLDAQFKANDLDASFTKAWSLFHDSFDNNQGTLVVALRESFRSAVKVITPLNLNATVTLLRELGEDEVAEELISYYVEQRGDETKIFNLEEYAFAGDITDPRVKARFDERINAGKPPPPLLEAVRAIAQGSWTRVHEQALDQATEEDLYKLLKESGDDKLHRLVKACIRFGGVAGHQVVGQRVQAVLERISKESKVNEVRVRRYLK